MNNAVIWLLVIVGGFLLGVVFFGGLWFTTKKSLTSKSPALWFLGSFIFRFGLILSGFYFISNQQWQRMLLCLLGFILARLVVLRFTHPAEYKTVLSKGGES